MPSDADATMIPGIKRERSNRKGLLSRPAGFRLVDPELNERASLLAFLGMGLLGLWGMFAVGAPLPIMHGTIWVGFGLLLLLLPPVYRVGWPWLIAGGLMLAGAALALGPAAWFGKPEWRVALEALGVGTGSQVTTQPDITMALWLGMAISVVASWYLLGHRVSEQAFPGLILMLALGIAGYAVVSMVAYQQKPRWTWDPVETFGLFGNRNHTATVLVMGALCGLGSLMQAVRSKRNGASLALLAIAVCVWGLLGYSISRAGVILLGTGLIGWLAGLGLSGRRYFSRRFWLLTIATLTAAGSIFWFTGNSLRQRLEDSWSKLADNQVQGQEETSPKNGKFNSPADEFDLRSSVYRDTFRMTGKEPISGVGLGQFRFVFPQYRKEAGVENEIVHPESSWLGLAAEAGWLTAVTLALVLGGLFIKAFRVARQHRGWPLTLAVWIAAAVIPLHALFDVPGNHVGISWPAMWLLALIFRPEDSPAQHYGKMGKAGFRLLGTIILLGGIGIFLTGGPKGGLSWGTRVNPAITEATSLYERDIAEKKDPVGVPPERKPDGTPVDQLEAAQKVINDELRRTPLDRELHYFRGLLSLSFTDEEAITDQAFAAQRLLEPDMAETPFRQGLGWLKVDPERTIVLWREARRRASMGASRQIASRRFTPAELDRKIRAEARDYPKVIQGIFTTTD